MINGGANMHGLDAALARRVLIRAPIDGDAEAVSHVIRAGGHRDHICHTMHELSEEVLRGAGTVIVAQEAFSAVQDSESLAQLLEDQPSWSDLPLILLAGSATGEEQAWYIARGLDPVGNVTILERPLRRTTLLNAVAVAMRARERQYELRAMLNELGQHREHLRDLVEKRSIELANSMANLRTSERLASLVTMAAGLGHDIANLTLPIKARLDVLREATSNSETHEDIDAIGQAIEHLSHLSAGMRLMSMDPQRIDASAMASDLTSWAAETVPMLRAGLPRHVRLEHSIAPGLGIAVARHRLAQAVFNLVQNAGEAMINQAAGVVTLAAAQCPRNPAMVTLTVADNGAGMTPEVLARCFEPYFSTKGRSIATGMGLGMVKGIVEAAGGEVSVTSTVGRGTAFVLTLPALRALIRERREKAARGAITVRSERIESLTRILMSQLEMESVRHPGPDAPDTHVWVVEDPGPAQLADFLNRDTCRRAVVLSAGVPPPHAAPGREPRVIRLSNTPTSAALRGALAATQPKP